ncbi:penicillin-binding protein 2 [Allofranklinella schreckenbergeri]|uniref:Peptidoglycan D,D-transpeptidase FtsI n=1 Tax=Allofranklinella schreckenbergeri TaxID=1076744 RepID=A0A3M6QG00_9BURK|nr:penicillin-binding protein 2 [Allofranklinella schreckenbergeri]RMW99625.1 penicillin-binding protein 2 [Allofranklinella schreckenbergeri]RMX02026.1 penicillin-binding protein 2 [Allofranklinella schreckenbergeri]
MSRVRPVAYATSPLLASKAPVWRSRFVLVMLALVFLGLIVRAAYVQVFSNEFFQTEGEKRYARTVDLPANRGKVLDRNGLILASSVPFAIVSANPTELRKGGAKASDLTRLAELLGITLKELNDKLASISGFGQVRVGRPVEWEIGQQIQALGIHGVYLEKGYKRQYPEGPAVSHIVGFTNLEDKGQEGIEAAYDAKLAGVAGSRREINNRLEQTIEGYEVAPVDGSDVHLAIDSKVQFFTNRKLLEQVQAHKAKAGSVVVLDARTGEILALANYPNYDPAERSRLTRDELYHRSRNRALTDVFEPGSVMKPLTVAMALEAGVVNPRTVINTHPGHIMVTGARLSDVRNFGNLTVEGIIQKSSNVGTTKLAQMMESSYMWEVLSAVGFGERPQIGFPAVASGSLRPWKTWRPVEKATMSYGYGLSASLLQMARAYTVFANEGVLLPASLIRREQPPVGVQVFSPKTARAVLKMLQMAAAPGGSGQRAQTVGYSVGGKSGTARKQIGKHYAANKYRSWFVGLAPIEDPRIIVAVMIDEPSAGQYYGGAVAAPLFSQVVQQTLRLLGVQPDMDVKPQIVASGVDEEEVLQ